MQIKKIFGVLTLALAMTFGASSLVAAGASAAEAEKVIAEAEAARKKAASVGGEWRDTGKMIKQAQAAVKAGEHDKAIKIATTAKRQGELGYEQAMSQKSLRMPSYLK